MEPTANDLRELKRILSLGSTPYVEHLLGLEIKKLEEKHEQDLKNIQSEIKQEKDSVNTRFNRLNSNIHELSNR